MSATEGFKHRDLNGVSGWLVFPTIATFLMPILTLKDYGEIVSGYWAVPVWTAPMYVFFAFVTTAVVVQLGAQAYAIACWGRRSVNYPLAFIAAGLAGIGSWGIVNFVLVPAYGVAVDFNGQLVGEIARNVAFLCVWVPYMLVSKRVRATFTK